jgi:hypothetical protein
MSMTPKPITIFPLFTIILPRTLQSVSPTNPMKPKSNLRSCVPSALALISFTLVALTGTVSHAAPTVWNVNIGT